MDFPVRALDLFGACMGLREDLAEILGRPVDVTTLRGVRSPLLLESLRRDAARCLR
jgi:predicted nucleotidyltransferase